MRGEVSMITTLMDEAFKGPAWHGASLKRTLAGVGVEEALWRPDGDRHCIWELALHCAYWKYRVRARASGERARFARRGSNFPNLPDEPSDEKWSEDLALLTDTHRAIREYAGTLKDSDLDRVIARGSTVRDQLRGIALHDTYHGGQIRLLRVLGASTSRGQR